jgi:hypothetical protein
MSVKIRIPFVFRKYTDQKKYIETGPGKVSDILTNISEDYPGLASKILEEDNSLKGNSMLFLDKKKPRMISDVKTIIKDGETLRILVVTGGG